MSRNNKDISEKVLEGYDDVFADIMNVFLFHGRQIANPDAMEDVMPVFSYKAEDGLHEEERDIAKYWKEGKIIIAMVGHENQTEEESDMVFRIIGYDGAAYRMQVLHGNTGYPVITLVLYYGSTHWRGSRHLKDHLDIPEELKDYVNDYQINVFEISFLTEEEINLFKSDFKYVTDYFAKIRTEPDYKGSDGELKHVDAVMKLISAVSGRPYDGPAREKAKKGKIKTMKNAINEIFDKAESKARAEGKAEGKAEGNVEGRKAQAMESAAAMLSDGMSDESVMKYSQLSREDVESVRREIGMVLQPK